MNKLGKLKVTCEVGRPRVLLKKEGEFDENNITLEIEAPEIAKTMVSKGLDLALLLDFSGSMEGAKLDIVKKAAIKVIESLKANDNLCVIGYSSTSKILYPMRPAGEFNTSGAKNNLLNASAYGCTEMCLAFNDAADQFSSSPGRSKIAIVLTDGAVTDNEANGKDTISPSLNERYNQAKKTFSNKGIILKCLGIGDDYDQFFLENLDSANEKRHISVSDRDYNKAITQMLGEFREIVSFAGDCVYKDCVIEIKPFMNKIENVALINDGNADLRKKVTDAASPNVFKIGQFKSGQKQRVAVSVLTPTHNLENEYAIAKVTVTATDLDNGTETEQCMAKYCIYADQNMINEGGLVTLTRSDGYTAKRGRTIQQLYLEERAPTSAELQELEECTAKIIESVESKQYYVDMIRKYNAGYDPKKVLNKEVFAHVTKTRPRDEQ